MKQLFTLIFSLLICMSLSAIAEEGGGNSGNNGNNSGQQQGNNGNSGNNGNQGNQGNNGNSGNHENGEEGEEDEGEHEGGSGGNHEGGNGGNHEDGDHEEGEEGGGQGNNSAYIIQIGGNNRAYINQESVHNGIASIDINGNDNNAYIMQKGNGGIAGSSYEATTDPCHGFSVIFSNGDPSGWSSTQCLSNIELACGKELVITPASFSFALVAPGIHINGDKNKAMIEQRGKTGIAGIQITGDKNIAKIDQRGNSGQAYINITSGELRGNVRGLIANISQRGKTNFAYTILKGISTDPSIKAGAIILQEGNSNNALQYSEGNDIQLGIDQSGNSNVARQVNKGDVIFMGIKQSGSSNVAIEMSTGNYNKSYIEQNGSRNEALILQGQPNVCGVTGPSVSVN
ncbi:hypothetical protein [Prolixibacter sp. NT017]|uniref:hypothetical protein n=1 Tax=Prolixibacter sp. NT017 TaxID=2652390 RepID=UPI00129911F8|nr:hypothetical protein [Prolixibacter sp. NT017]